MKKIDGDALYEEIANQIHRYEAQNVTKGELCLIISHEQMEALDDFTQEKRPQTFHGVLVVIAMRNYIEPTVLPKSAISSAVMTMSKLDHEEKR